MYREDYARGGIQMLPVIEPDGESTANRIVACSVLLIPISLVPRLLGMAGPSMRPLPWRLVWGCSTSECVLAVTPLLLAARHVLLAPVLCLPIVLALMVIDRRGS